MSVTTSAPLSFEREIVPVEVGAAGAAVLVGVDENPRRDTSLEKLAALPAAFKDGGKITEGNSSAIVDGAAAMRVASDDAAARLGLEQRARFVSFGLAGVDPYRMLHGNPLACERALAKAGLGWDDISVTLRGPQRLKSLPSIQIHSVCVQRGFR